MPYPLPSAEELEYLAQLSQDGDSESEAGSAESPWDLLPIPTPYPPSSLTIRFPTKRPTGSYMETDHESESLGTADTWSVKSGSTESTAKFTDGDDVSMDDSELGSVATEESCSSVTATEMSYTSGGTAVPSMSDKHTSSSTSKKTPYSFGDLNDDDDDDDDDNFQLEDLLAKKLASSRFSPQRPSSQLSSSSASVKLVAKEPEVRKKLSPRELLQARMNGEFDEPKKPSKAAKKDGDKSKAPARDSGSNVDRLVKGSKGGMSDTKASKASSSGSFRQSAIIPSSNLQRDSKPINIPKASQRAPIDRAISCSSSSTSSIVAISEPSRKRQKTSNLEPSATNSKKFNQASSISNINVLVGQSDKTPKPNRFANVPSTDSPDPLAILLKSQPKGEYATSSTYDRNKAGIFRTKSGGASTSRLKAEEAFLEEPSESKRIRHSPANVKALPKSRVLVPSSSTDQIKEPTAKTGVKKKATRIESDSDTDIDITPQAKEKQPVKKDSPNTTPRKARKKESGVIDFTGPQSKTPERPAKAKRSTKSEDSAHSAEGSSSGKDREAKVKAVADATAQTLADMVIASLPTAVAVEEPRIEIEDDFTPEERAYCNSYIDPQDICKYCAVAMPLSPSPQVCKMRIELDILAAKRNNGDMLPWQTTVEFCAIHEAETTIIPLGIRAGYPETISFAQVPDRLEFSWLREELQGIMHKPERSAFFNKVVRDIGKKGKSGWADIGNQGAKQVVDYSMPGYYGHLGRTIILRHFSNLLMWGLLPSLSNTDEEISPIYPLTPLEFIGHIMVPEAAIRLIMSDQGWTGQKDKQTPEWKTARGVAFRVWKDSVEYGRWKYREDSEEAKSVMRVLRKKDASTKIACEMIRDKAQHTWFESEDESEASQAKTEGNERMETRVSTPVSVDNPVIEVPDSPASQSSIVHLPTPPKSSDSNDHHKATSSKGKHVDKKKSKETGGGSQSKEKSQRTIPPSPTARKFGKVASYRDPSSSFDADFGTDFFDEAVRLTADVERDHPSSTISTR